MADWKGTTIPNSGNVTQNIYINKTKINDFINIDFSNEQEILGSKLYYISAIMETNSQQVGFTLHITKSTNSDGDYYNVVLNALGNQIDLYDGANNQWQESEYLVSLNEEIAYLPIQEYLQSMSGNFEFISESVSSDTTINIGQQNEKIKDFFSYGNFYEQQLITNLPEWLRSVANAIRTKKGTTDKINAQDYSSEILSIESGASGEPILIESQEEFDNIIANAKEEDNGKIYIFEDKLYKLVYSLGTLVPNSGYVENVYFNNNLSVEEVNNICSQLTYINNPLTNGLTYNMMLAEDGNAFIVFKHPTENEYSIILSTLSSTNIRIYLFTSYTGEDSETDFVGWNEALFNNPEYKINPAPVNQNVISDYNGMSIGTENSKLSNLFSITPFEESENIGGVVLVETQGGTPIPTDGSYIENLYINTSLSIEEVVSILSGLTYDEIQEGEFGLFIGGNTTKGILAIFTDGNAYSIIEMLSGIPLFADEFFAQQFEVDPGWNSAIGNIFPVNEKTLTSEELSEVLGMPITLMDTSLISNIISITPNFEPRKVELSGTYDGSKISVEKSGVLDVETLLSEGKLPLEIDFKGELGGINVVESFPESASEGQTIIHKKTYTKGTMYMYDGSSHQDVSSIAKTYIVDEIPPVEDIEPSTDSSFVFYTIDGLTLYYNDNGTLSNTNQLMGIEFKGIVDSISEMTIANSLYVLRGSETIEVKMYQYIDGAWVEKIAPQGSLSISKNGTFDVGKYKNAEVNVVFEDEITIKTNGTYNVSQYGSAIVDTNEIVDTETKPTTSDIDYYKYDEFVKYNSYKGYVATRVYIVKNGVSKLYEPFRNNQIHLPTKVANVVDEVIINIVDELPDPSEMARTIYIPVLYCTPNGDGLYYSKHNVLNKYVNESIGTFGGVVTSSVVDLTQDKYYIFREPDATQENVAWRHYVYTPRLEEVVVPKDTYTITENGTHDVSTYANVEVNVASSGEDMLQALIDTNKSTQNLFLKYKGVDFDDFVNLDTSQVTIMDSMFSECPNITNVKTFPFNTSNATSMNSLFRQNRKFISLPISILETSKVTSMDYMFYDCRVLQTIPQLETSKVTNMNYMFYECRVLQTIPQLDMRSVTTNNASSMFYNCKALTNLTLKNIKAKLQIGSGTSWGHLLTLESLLNTCQECINTGSSLTLTIGSANLEKLASVYVKLTNAPEEDETLPKLPMVQCESTDEGAMSVADYMAMKNWTLA